MSAVRSAAITLVLCVFAVAPGGGAGGPLAAHQITAGTAAADLFGGSDSIGGIGDWYLSNGVVEAVVDDVGVQADLAAAGAGFVSIQNHSARTGGTLVDLALSGQDNDQLTSMFTVINNDANLPVLYLPAGFVLDDPALPRVIAAQDVDEASLTVHGLAVSDPAAPTLHITTTYAVREGEPFLRLRTELTNENAVSVPLTTVGDAFLHAGEGGTTPFTAHPDRGFELAELPVVTTHHSVLGRVRPADGIAEDGRPAGEASYTMISLQSKLLSAGQGKIASVVNRPAAPTLLAPGASFVFERRLYVGARNDVAASADPALATLLDDIGVARGTVQGRLESPDGHAFRANLEFAHLDLVPQVPGEQTIISWVTGNDAPVPTSQVLTDDARNGAFEATLPVGRHRLTILGEERDPIGPIEFEVTAGGVTDLGTLALSTTGTLHISLTDTESGALLPGRVTVLGWGNPDPAFGVPLDLAYNETKEALGIGGWYAPPFGRDAYLALGQTDLVLRPGRYRLIASHGPEFDMAWTEIVVAAGGDHAASLALTRVVDTDGWLASDFHIHAAPSADSSVPPQARVETYVAEGVQVMVSSDHDTLFDYAPVIAGLGLGGEVTSIVGVEVSSTADVDPSDPAKGHFNGWPLVPQPHARKNGAPEDGRVQPNVVFDRLRGLGAQVIQVNHPTWPNNGFLTALGYDPAQTLDQPVNAGLFETSALGTGTRNIDFDLIEVHNGIDRNQNAPARAAWFSLLDQGVLKTGTAASDSHRIDRLRPGYPRTYVRHPGGVPGFEVSSFNTSLLGMQAFGTSGPFLEVEAVGSSGDRAGMGEVLTETGSISLEIVVRAPCWMPVDRVKIHANGDLLSELSVAQPCTSTERLNTVVDVTPVADTWLVVTAEEDLPRTSPGNFEDALYLFTFPNVIFEGFTNPILLDADGNGTFDAPGL